MVAASDPAAGLRTLGANLGRAAGTVGARGSQVVRATAARVERDAKILAPVDTGNLRNSISTTLTGDGRSKVMSAEVGPTASYGRYVELGTSRMAAQPYLFPALDRHEDNFTAAMARIATEGL